MLPAAFLACAVGVAPATLEAIIKVESLGNAAATHVNRNGTVDLGLMQINSTNLPAFGLSASQVMDPCTNIRVGTAILRRVYASAVSIYGEGQKALQVALSMYNTNSPYRGFANGYVAKYYTHLPILPDIRPADAKSLPLSPYAADPQVFWNVEIDTF